LVGGAEHEREDTFVEWFRVFDVKSVKDDEEVFAGAIERWAMKQHMVNGFERSWDLTGAGPKLAETGVGLPDQGQALEKMSAIEAEIGAYDKDLWFVVEEVRGGSTISAVSAEVNGSGEPKRRNQ
jgi:hypothetical protein